MNSDKISQEGNPQPAPRRASFLGLSLNECFYYNLTASAAGGALRARFSETEGGCVSEKSNRYF
jgi:hypothetical protein